MLDDSVYVRKMTSDDLHSVAVVHSIAFSGFFLDAMGKPFLRAYYDIVLRYPGSISLVAEDRSGGLNGFVVGFVNPPGFYSFLRSKWLHLLPSAICALLRRPDLFVKILLSNLRVRKKSKRTVDDSESAIELASIAVSSKKNGVGSRLIQEFLSQCRGSGAASVNLTTDMKDNGLVQNFYRKHGFSEKGIEHHGRREMLVFERKL